MEFIIIASQSIGGFMQGYLNPEEIGLTQTIEGLEQKIEDLEQKNIILEAQISGLNNKIKLLSTNSSPNPQ